MNLVKISNLKNTIVSAFNKSAPLLSLAFKNNNSTLRQSDTIVNNFSSWCGSINNLPVFTSLSLKPFNPIVIPFCGFKVKGRLKKRCEHCYFERKDGRLYVMCSVHPRHKQMALVKREKYTWILTYAFQSKLRPY